MKEKVPSRGKHDGVREYLQRVSRHLNYPRSQKKQMLKEIKAIVLEIPGAASMSLEELETVAGDPEGMASTYQAEMDLEQIKNLQKRNLALRLVIVACLVILVALASWYVLDTFWYNHGYMVEGPAITGVYTPPSGSGVTVY